MATASDVIKAYIQHAESRRTSSRFNTTRPRNGSGARSQAADDGDKRVEAAAGDGEPLGERSGVAAVAGLFVGKHKYTARRTPAPVQPAAAVAAGLAPPGTSVARRKLRTDLATLAMSPRPPALPLAGSSRPRHNLAAKLDMIARTSPWMRRRVILGGDKGLRGLFRSVAATSPRYGGGSGNNGAGNGVGSNGRAPGGGDAGARGHDAASEAEMEKRVIAAFSRIVRRWRERKKQSEQAAISIVHGQAGAGSSTAGAAAASRFAPKLQRELDAQSSNVVSILSRRMIREVPALKFFDEGDDGDASVDAGASKGKPRGPNASGGAPTTAAPAAAKAHDVSAKASARQRVSEPPRGVCYTLDESGCRRIKMQSGVVRAGAVASSTSRNAGAALPAQGKLEGISMEAAMGKSLRRKMARRVKTKRLAILRLGDNFDKSQRDMALKLSAKLALHQAESDKMFSKKMAVLCSDAAAAPPYLAQRELALARARVRKVALIEKCRTLHALGAVLRRIENTGDMSGQDISAGELHFLEIFRCIVETDQVLTPLLAEGVKCEFSDAQLETPLVSNLFQIFDQHVVGEQVAIEEAWSNPTAVSPTG